MSEPFASGRKRPGLPWEIDIPSSRAGKFDPEHFTLTVSCPQCHEPAHVEAACIAGVVAVTVGACRHCGIVGNVLLEHARRAAGRVLVDRGVIGGGVA
jgi:hypothetical protein